MNSFFRSILNVLLLSLLLTSTVLSQDTIEKHPILNDKFEIELGIFYPSKKVVIAVDGDHPNDDISFEKTFGLKDQETTTFVGTTWRFASKWKLSVDYFGLKSSGKRVLEEDLQWEDLTFEEGTNISASSRFNLYRIYLGRIFTSGAKHEFGGGLGIHAINLSAKVAGDAYMDYDDHSYESSRKTVILPLPNFGLWYFYAPTKKWALVSKLDLFYISINDFTGSLLNFTPGISYQFSRHFGTSINYRFIDLGAEFKTYDWKGQFNTTFYGPSLTFTASF